MQAGTSRQACSVATKANRGPAHTGPIGGQKFDRGFVMGVFIIFVIKPDFLQILVKLINSS